MSDPFELVRVRSGAWGIRSLRYEETCHPGIGPRAEAEALYVRGLDLPRRFAHHASAAEANGDFVVWDIGLGGGANAAAVMKAAQDFPMKLRVLSFDRSLGQLQFALRHEAELDCLGTSAQAASQLLETGACSFRHGQAAIQWECVLGDFTAWVASDQASRWPAPYAILFDPHSPVANPEMWTLTLFRDLYARLDPDQPCGLATYSRATSIRVALLVAGFVVGVGGGTGTKEETTLAANRPELAGQPLGTRWLERARRSHAAEPWTTPPFGGQPLTQATRQALERHPQFATPEPPDSPTSRSR